MKGDEDICKYCLHPLILAPMPVFILLGITIGLQQNKCVNAHYTHHTHCYAHCRGPFLFYTLIFNLLLVGC